MADKKSILQKISAVSLVCLALSACEFAPVPPPPRVAEGPTSNSSDHPEASSVRTVAPKGFTDYERAALRVRNVGCGSVSSGSGFAISDHVFVTNRHVVGGATVLQVSTFDGHDIDVDMAGSVQIADLALVWTDDALPATLSLAPHNPAVGSNVTAVGFPLGGQLTTTHGKVLGYGPDPIGWSPIPMLLNDAPIEHGSSGSPLINDFGQLVGVAYAGDGTHYYAVPIDVLRQVLNEPSSFSRTSSCDGAP